MVGAKFSQNSSPGGVQRCGDASGPLLSRILARINWYSPRRRPRVTFSDMSSAATGILRGNTITLDTLISSPLVGEPSTREVRAKAHRRLGSGEEKLLGDHLITRAEDRTSSRGTVIGPSVATNQ